MDTEAGAKPPREMRTVRRDGDIITEDHEKLNPDGTVTKVVTMIDSKTGMQHTNVYKMDKSGIVRKMDESEIKAVAERAKTQAFLQQLKDQSNDAKADINTIREHNDKVNSTSVAYETGDGAYLRRVEEKGLDHYDLGHKYRNIQKPLPLSPKQQTLLSEHKENILNYGAQKLIKQLSQKLNEDKFNKTYSLTDDQKDKVVEYGVQKLQRLLEKNLDDERLVYDLMAFNPEFGQVDLSGRGVPHIPGNQSVSFSLNPYENLAPEDIAKPVSFSMRPEKPKEPLADNQDGKRENRAYQAIWNKLMKSEQNTDQSTLLNNSNLKDDEDDTDSDWQSDSATQINGKTDFKKIKESVKNLIAEDESYKNSKLTQKEKDDVINYAMKGIRSVFKGSDDEKRKQKKKIDLSDYFDEDEIFDYGKKALKKLVRRSLKAFDLDQDMLSEENDNPKAVAKKNAFYQYLGDVIEGRLKESDPIPIKVIKEKPQEETKDKKWDYQSFLSSIFGKKEIGIPQKSEEKSKGQEKKDSDFDSFFSWLRDAKEDKKESNKEVSSENEIISKIKPRFYQLEPTADATNEQKPTESENKGFDLKSLLRKIQEAAVRRFSDSKTSENTEKFTHQKLEPSPQSVENSSNYQGGQEKVSVEDDTRSRVRGISSDVLKKPLNKPPYLKERIAGLDSIPRPTIVTASPPSPKKDLTNEISFQLKPHSYDNGSQQEGKTNSLEMQNKTTKPSAHEQDFQPWWFESPESFLKKAIEKPLLKEAFIDTPMINSSFSIGKNEKLNNFLA